VLGFPAPERLPLWSFSGAARLQVGCCGAPRPRAVGGPRAPAGRGDPFGHHGVRPLGDPGHPRVRGDPKGKKKERARGPAGSGSSGLGCSRPSGVSPGVYFVGRGRHRDLLFFPVYAGHLDVVWCLGGWSSSAWRTVTTARGISSGSGDRGTGMPICVLGVELLHLLLIFGDGSTCGHGGTAALAHLAVVCRRGHGRTAWVSLGRRGRRHPLGHPCGGRQPAGFSGKAPRSWRIARFRSAGRRSALSAPCTGRGGAGTVFPRRSRVWSHLLLGSKQKYIHTYTHT